MAFRVRVCNYPALDSLLYIGRRCHSDLGPFRGSGHFSGLGSYRYENHPIESPNRGKPILGSGHVLGGDFARTTVPGHIDVMVTDIVMPRMGGPEMVEKLRRKRNSFAVIFMSGYT